jgi:hypothetical protein
MAQTAPDLKCEHGQLIRECDPYVTALDDSFASAFAVACDAFQSTLPDRLIPANVAMANKGMRPDGQYWLKGYCVFVEGATEAHKCWTATVVVVQRYGMPADSRIQSDEIPKQVKLVRSNTVYISFHPRYWVSSTRCLPLSDADLAQLPPPAVARSLYSPTLQCPATT